MKKIAFLLIVLFAFISCTKDPYFIQQPEKPVPCDSEYGGLLAIAYTTDQQSITCNVYLDENYKGKITDSQPILIKTKKGEHKISFKKEDNDSIIKTYNIEIIPCEANQLIFYLPAK